jgi:hypothetical protein
MKKIILVLTIAILFSSVSLAAVKEFARGSFRDKNNKFWANTISYEITTKDEVDKFIIGKRVIAMDKKNNSWVVVVER